MVNLVSKQRICFLFLIGMMTLLGTRVALAQSQYFADVPTTVGYFNAVSTMLQRGITTGCSSSPPMYCPDQTGINGATGIPLGQLTRGQMAAFLIRSLNYEQSGNINTFSPAVPQTPYFTDVPSSDPFFQYVQQMMALGITQGCGTGLYCPNDAVTTGQVAVFAVRARQLRDSGFVNNSLQCGVDYYQCTPYYPTDAPATHAFFPWIQRAREILGPVMKDTEFCGNGDANSLCPDAPIWRGQMAYYLDAIVMPTAYPIPTGTNFTFYSQPRNRAYTVTTQALGTAITNSGGWMYEPSAIVASSLTSFQYVLLFSSNRTIPASLADEAVYMSTSSNGYSGFSSKQVILRNSGTNICDMIDARPVWDGSLWHVYVQGKEYTSGTSGSCSTNVGPGASAIYEATGTSLTALTWVTTSPGIIKRIVQINSDPSHDSQTGPAIGEVFQWFNTSSYLGPSSPFLVVYNDWNWLGGPTGSMFAALSSTGNDANYWYNTPGTAYTPVDGPHYPDVILGNSIDSSSLGNPSFTVAAGCVTNNSQYHHMDGIAFYPDPVPYIVSTGSSRPIQGGQIINGHVASTSSDSIGPRGFTPRFARNEFGYLDPTGSSPKTWQTFFYYNDAQINVNGSDDCSGYSNHSSSDQRLSVSQITITEQ
jgi:hypothetical protein